MPYKMCKNRAMCDVVSSKVAEKNVTLCMAYRGMEGIFVFGSKK